MGAPISAPFNTEGDIASILKPRTTLMRVTCAQNQEFTKKVKLNLDVEVTSLAASAESAVAARVRADYIQCLPQR